MKKVIMGVSFLFSTIFLISCTSNGSGSLTYKLENFISLHQEEEVVDYSESSLYYYDYNIESKEEWTQMSRESIKDIAGDELGNKLVTMWQLDAENETNISVVAENPPVITLDSYKDLVIDVVHKRFGDDIEFTDKTINGVEAFTTNYQITDIYDKELKFNVSQVCFRSKANFITLTFTERVDIENSKLNEFEEFINSLEKI